MAYCSQDLYQSEFGNIARRSKEEAKKMRRYIEENEIMASGIATRIAKDGNLESLLGKEVCARFREELKENAKENVGIERRLEAYLEASNTVAVKAHEAMIHQTEIKPHEYSEQMEVEYNKALESVEAKYAAVPVTEAPIYTKLCNDLGEVDNDDEELAVVNDHDTSEAAIKCPLTMSIMTKPVKSSVCHHTYEEAAILQHLTKSQKCPKAGCSNKRMTRAELSDDLETAMKIRRFKKREEATQKAMARSSNLDMDDDEEEEATFQ